MRTRFVFEVLGLAWLLSAFCTPAFAQDESDDDDDERESAQHNVLSMGPAVAVSFEDGDDPAIGLGLQYERVISSHIGVAVGLAVSSVNLDDDVVFGAGVSLPIYVLGTAPTGFFVAPGVSTAFIEDFNLGIGLSVGGQYVFDRGLALNVAFGPALVFVDEDATGAIGASAAVGYAF